MKLLNKSLCSMVGMVLIVGCGGEVQTKITEKQAEARVMGGAAPDEQTKVKEFLDKAKIEGTLVSLESKENYWLAEVQKPTTPGKRGSAAPPTGYKVDKTTGNVTKYGP
jgi:hypothetical protein